MEDFEPDVMSPLIEAPTGLQLSAYLPMVPAGDTEQNRIRLRNLLRGTRAALEGYGVEKRTAERVVDALSAEADEPGVAEHQAEGLAVFADLESCRMLKCHRSFAPLLTVGDQYHVLPLLPLIDEAQRYWILALSRDQVRLVSACRNTGAECDLTGTRIPRSLSDVVGTEVDGQSLQFHSNTRGRAAQFHGQGRGHDDVHTELERFCRTVAEALADELDEARTTLLVLAGEERLTAMFQQVAEGRLDIDPQTLRGNHDRAKPDELARAAWTIAGRAIAAREAEFARQFDLAMSRHRATDSAQAILDAADHGRIDVLLLSDGRLTAGAAGRDDDALRNGGRMPAKSESIANRAALATLRHGGTAHVLENVPMPTQSPIAAVLRY